MQHFLNENEIVTACFPFWRLNLYLSLLPLFFCVTVFRSRLGGGGRSNRLRLLIFEQRDRAGKVCMCLPGDADCKCSPEEGGAILCLLISDKHFCAPACTLTAPRHPAGGANVSLSQHHSSASRSYLYLEATRCPREPSAKYHVLFAQTGIIVGTKSICSNTVSLSKWSPC